jgi:hypothetical protein
VFSEVNQSALRGREMKYFIPEWNDRVDAGYNFEQDAHSEQHRIDPVRNDVYAWDLFGVDNVPLDGVLVSRTVIMERKKNYEWALKEGIHKVLHLPRSFEIMGDCGAFNYVGEKVPPYDPIETLKYYSALGFNYGVSVDHLVVKRFETDKDYRMKLTYENGLKSYNHWSKKFRKDFQLIVAVQGWEVADYLHMYHDYLNHGITHIGFGGLAGSPTGFIMDLVHKLIETAKEWKKSPEYMHFFGLARFSLFPMFKELEGLGIRVGFDSASYLRKAWLSSPGAQLNYLSLKGTGYTAIRVPYIDEKFYRKAAKQRRKIDLNSLRSLEKQVLANLREYDKDKGILENAVSSISSFNKAAGISSDLIDLYKRTIKEKPWQECPCRICKNVGIEVVIFRGNDRNRRRGFHNTYVFYEVLKHPEIWNQFIKGKTNQEVAEFPTIESGDRILVVTGCSKTKLTNKNSVKAPARKMYQGKLFRAVRDLCETHKLDYVIISSKFGLLKPEDVICGYDEAIRKREDVLRIRPIVEEKLQPLLPHYDKIIVVAGERYREVLQDIWDERFYIVRGRGYTDLCHKVRESIPKGKTLLDFS